VDRHLRSGPSWPKAPLLEIRLDDGGSPVGAVTADRSGEVRRVDVHYSLDDKVPGARFWRTARVDSAPGGWKASLPVADAWKSLSAFANVYYVSGVCLSSNLAQVTPGQLGRARATLLWSPRLDDDAGGIHTWYFVPAYVDPNVSWSTCSRGR